MYEIGYTEYDAGGRWVGVNYDAACKMLLSGPSLQEQERWLQAEAQEAGLAGKRRFSLQAWPNSEAEVRNLHTDGVGGFRHILSYPPILREAGFGMVNGGRPVVLLPEGGLRVKLQLRNLGTDESWWSLSLQRNGLLTWVVPAGSDFLAMGDINHRTKNCINPVAMVESVFEFVRLFTLTILPNLVPSPITWSIGARLEGLHADMPYSSLPKGLSSIRLPFATEAVPHDSIIVKSLTWHDEPPGKIAFQLLRQVYAGFGYDESAIPLAQGGEIKQDLILGLRR